MGNDARTKVETMKRIKKYFWSSWKVAKTIWPYPEGYGTYRTNYLTGERMILDTGLSYDHAKATIKELNA